MMPNHPTIERYPTPEKEIDCDVAVIGGGHNGLVAAFYLAKSGYRVTIVEKEDRLGGSVHSAQLIPDFCWSIGAQLGGALDPEIADDMGINEKVIYRPLDPQFWIPVAGINEGLGIWLEERKTRENIAAACGEIVAEDYTLLNEWIVKAVDAFGPIFNQPPKTWKETAEKLKEAGLSNAEIREIFKKPLVEFLKERFRNNSQADSLITLLCLVPNVNPYKEGSLFSFIDSLARFTNIPGHPGVSGYVEGGMESIIKAMEQACREQGVTILTNCIAENFTVKQEDNGQRLSGRVIGAIIQNTREGGHFLLKAKCVISTIPVQEIYKLISPQYVTFRETDWLAKHAEEGHWGVAHVAFEKMPEAIPGRLRRGVISVGTSTTEELRRVFNYRSDEAISIDGANFPPRLTLQGYLVDEKGAMPEGKAMAIFLINELPYNENETAKHPGMIAQWVKEILGEAFPGVTKDISDCRVITPRGLEVNFGLPKGNLEQVVTSAATTFLHRQPEFKRGPRKTGLLNLVLSGAGSHPGIFVTGVPGKQAAGQVIEMLKRELS